jgi:GNAT superfamily N-acetyltransferase
MREFQPSEYGRLAELYGTIYPDYDRSPNEFRFWDESLDRSKYLRKRYSCFDQASNQIIGFGEVGHATWMFHPQKFWLEIWVDPAHQGRGIGSAIYSKLSEDMDELDAVMCWAMAKEDMSAPLAFLAKRGFKERMKSWESRLNPAQVSLSDYSNYSQRASEGGIVILSLAEERRQNPECLKKLYDLIQTVAADMPMPDQFTPTSYEQWLAAEVNAPGLAPEGYMIAKDGSSYVGLSTVWLAEKEAKGLYQGLTGVRRAYRGHGIAVALKLKVIDFAQRNGYQLIKTWNASINAPMLAINHKLGFKRQVGWITFEKNLV